MTRPDIEPATSRHSERSTTEPLRVFNNLKIFKTYQVWMHIWRDFKTLKDQSKTDS